MSSSVCDQCGAQHEAQDAVARGPVEGDARPLICGECGAQLGHESPANADGEAALEQAEPSSGAGLPTAPVVTPEAAPEPMSMQAERAELEPVSARAERAELEPASERAEPADLAAVESAPASELAPLSEEAITLKAPAVEVDPAIARAEPERDSVIPLESQDFVDEAPRAKRLPKAPARPQHNPESHRDWLDELPMSAGTPTLAALVQRANSESEKPPAPAIPPELLPDPRFDLGPSDWEARLMPLLRTPTTDAPVVNSDAPPKAAPANRASMTLLVLAVAASAFAAGLSVRRPAPAPTAQAPLGSPRVADGAPAIHAARPATAPPEFAIEPAAPEQSPASLPLAEAMPKGSAANVGAPTGSAAASRAKPSVAEANASPTAGASTPALATPIIAVPAVATPAPAAAAPIIAAAPKPEASAAPPQGAEAEADGASEPPFDTSAAEAAIGAAATRAAGCKRPGDPKGIAVVTITFSSSGRATTANVAGEPFAGTATGGCIAATLRAARVPAFSGDFVTVKKSIKID